jgi:hypothetical protein
MNALKFLLLSVLAACAVSGCSNKESDEKPFSPKITQFKGAPKNFNGYWKGQGYIAVGQNKINDLTYHVEVSKTPTGLDLEVTANTSTGSNVMFIGLEQHYVTENNIFDARDNMLVGSIGSDGFSLARAELGELVARLNANGEITLDAFMLDEGQRYEFHAVISK